MDPQQREEGFIVSCSTPFADGDQHAVTDFVLSLLPRHTFVIGCNPCSGVSGCPLSFQSRRMSVHRFPPGYGCPDLGRDLLISVQYSRPVHHFGEVVDIITVEQIGNISGSQCGARRLMRSGRNTGGSAEIEFERNLISVVDHEVDPLQTADISNFMGIRDSGYRAVPDGSPGKLRRNEHGTLNMNVRVDKTGNDKLSGNIIRFMDGVDPSIPDVDGSVVDASVDRIKYRSSDLFHMRCIVFVS